MPIILREFDTTQPNIDFTDLSTTITVSGVRLLRDVTVKTSITDNISGEVDSASDFLENPYTSKLNVDILNQDGSVAYQNFLQNYKSNNFTFTEYDNINVFGQYEKDFGVQMKVVGQDDSEQTTKLFLYGNHPYISGIDIQDVSGTKRFSSAGGGSAISAIGQTGAISGVISFFNDPNYIVFDKLEVYSSKSSSEFVNQINPAIVLTTPILESSSQFAFNIGEGSFGFADSSEFFLHFVTYGQFGTGDVWTIGPHNFASTPIGSNELGLQSLQSVTDIGSTTSNEISLYNALNMSNESAEINFLGGAARVSATSAEGSSLGGIRFRSDKFNFDVSSAENSNEVNSFASVALAGTKNRIYGDFDAIVVGSNNIISGQEIDGATTGNADFNFIGAGSGIRIFESSFSSIVGGADNEINEDSENSFIGGGSGNRIAGSRNSVILGGIGNTLQSSESVQIFGSHVNGGGTVLNGYIYLSDDDNRTKVPTRADALFIDFNNGVDIKTGDLAVVEGITMSGGQPVATQSFVTSRGYITGISSSSVTSALGYIPVDPSTTGALVNDNDIANFITGISSSSVTGALGFTPISAVRTVTAGGNTLGAGETLAFGVGGDNIKVTESAGAVTIAVDGSAELPTATIPNLAASKITSSTFANARISESSVTQHQAALTLVSGQITGALGFTPLSGVLSSVRTVTAGGNTLGTSETLAFTAGSGIQITESAGAVTIASPSGVASDDVDFIVKLTQSEYDAITPDSNTLYFISDESTNSPVVNPIKIVSSNYTITDTDHTVLVSGSASTNITLPSAVNNSNYVYNIKNITTGAVAISGAVGLIDLTDSLIINSKFESVTVQSDGSNWYII